MNAAEPVLRIPSRARPIPESGRLLDRAMAVYHEAKAELAQLREERQNAVLEPGAGLFGFYEGLGFQGGGIFQDPSSQSFTLGLANTNYPVTLNWTLLSNSYLTQGLFRRVIDMVVDDAFGEGVKFESDELGDDVADLVSAFEEKRDRHSYEGTSAQRFNYNAGYDLTIPDAEACKLVGIWGRLFGGAGLIVNTTQRMDKELRVKSIGPDTPLTFIAADRWELILDQMNVTADVNPVPYNYYGNPLHRSRVARFVWLHAPSRIRQRLAGWGLSVIEECIRPVSAYLKFDKLLFELMDEAKVDVYKIKGYNVSLASRRGTEGLIARVQAANQAKNFQNALTMDAEDEWDQKTLAGIFPGLNDIRESLRVDLCAYLQIPYNKLFGQSAGGFGSGKDSLDNYHSTVRNFRKGIRPVVKEAAQLRSQQLFGFVPKDLRVEFQPLTILDGVEQEQVKDSQQKRIIERYTTGITTAQEASQELRKDELMTCDETEVEKGLRDAAPPPSQNPDEAEAGRKHEMKMADRKAAKDKGRSGASAKRR